MDRDFNSHPRLAKVVIVVGPYDRKNANLTVKTDGSRWSSCPLQIVDKDVDPGTTLLQYLRLKLGLTGTKTGCGTGGCGACTVMISRFNRKSRSINHMSVMACLFPLTSAHGAAVTTVEGLGSVENDLHPVQERIAKSHATQCGFCTPGMVMTMYTLLRNNAAPTLEQVEKELNGNLCRCTGYRGILDGFNTFTQECSMGENCCQRKAVSNEDGRTSERLNVKQFAPYDPSQEPIFPSELQMSDQFDSDSLYFEGESLKWYRPVTLPQLLALRLRYPDAKLVQGNTDVGVELKTHKYPVVISISHIPELSLLEVNEDGMKLGSSVTLSQLENVIETSTKTLPDFKRNIPCAILDILPKFGNRQIRNTATVAGNLMTASPAGDLLPILMASGATVTFVSPDGRRKQVGLDGKFFVGYRKTNIDEGNILLSIDIPFSRKHEYFGAYKQAIRRADDMATVNAAMRVVLGEDTDTVREISLCFGAMSSAVVSANTVQEKAVGRVWNEELVSDVCKWLKSDLQLSAGAPGGTAEYRQTLALSFFYRFYLSVLVQHHETVGKAVEVPSAERSAIDELTRGVSKGSVLYEGVAPGQPQDDPVGRNILTSSAFTNATGESVFVDDIPLYSNELHVGRVISAHAHARITRVDSSEAMTMPGVVDFLTHKDVPGSNMWGVEEQDEELFASAEVFCEGQTIAAILADSRQHALEAAKAVKVEYEVLDPLVTIEDAIKANSFYKNPMILKDGDVKKGLEEADHVIEGSVRGGGQEHFYLEPQSCLAIPSTEYRHMEVITSSQWLTLGQKVVAGALGVPNNNVICKTKRLGGGFGGKISGSAPFMGIAAVAAYKTKRPVRCVLEREEDLVSTGSRHPFLAKYKVGFTNNGRLTAVDLTFYGNAGFSLDVSRGFLEKFIFHACCPYKVPNVRITGYACKTNLPSNTPMRSFATCPATFTSETWMTDMALFLGMSQIQVREMNMYKEGDLTPFGQKLVNYNLPRCWQECLELSDFHNRRKEADQFNRGNRWKKRGLAMTTVQQGISLTVTHFNQAGVLVNIYEDGSVMLAHAGTEMGQGLNTKLIQVASRALKIPHSRIRIAGSSTETVPNAPPSSGSVNTDLNGMATLDACRTLMDRIDPIILDNPKGSWDEWIAAAFVARISLSATGFYKTPDIKYDAETLHGDVFNYFTTGVACTEVEIDCLTGDNQILRTDIVMDIGSSLNPTVDIGQIEGAFVQGCGHFLMEKIKISPAGNKRSRGTKSYKIPTARDIPQQLNVSFLQGSINPRTVYSSRGAGEPALTLAASAFYAVKDAILAARKKVGVEGNFQLSAPATPDLIRMACLDRFAEEFPEAEPGSYTPWYVDL